MSINHEVLTEIESACLHSQAKWVAVTKMRSIELLRELYHAGKKEFGENKAQELIEKYEIMPKDIEWHFIGHLQTNKVRSIIDKVEYIHAVDSEKLINEIQKEACRVGKIIKVFVQIHVAKEETKYGFSRGEVLEFFDSFYTGKYPNVEILGLMAIASLTEDKDLIRREFMSVHAILETINSDGRIALKELSMGMSSDYQIALDCGSTWVRIGSILYN